MNELYDIYGKLLSQKQQQIFEQYYLEDFSLTEIAENIKTSKQAVSQALKICEEKLGDYELKLQLIKKQKAREQLISGLISLYPKDKILSEHLKKLKEFDNE